jgi:hypothetical protein
VALADLASATYHPRMATKKSKSAKKKAKKSSKVKGAKRAAPIANTALAAPGSVVRQRVIEIFANVCGKKPSEVDGPPLSELTARCDVPFRAQIASAVNAEFNDLLQPYGSDDIACSATVSTLSMQIIRDQA